MSDNTVVKPENGDDLRGRAARNMRVEITRDLRGYFTVLVAEYYYADMDQWILKPWNSRFGRRYKTAKKAIPEGRKWARMEGVPFRNPITKELETFPVDSGPYCDCCC